MVAHYDDLSNRYEVFMKTGIKPDLVDNGYEVVAAQIIAVANDIVQLRFSDLMG